MRYEIYHLLQDFQKRDSTSSSSYQSQTSSEVETILNTILPPKGLIPNIFIFFYTKFYPSEFEEDGLVWRQQVSAKETNRRDVENLRSDGHLEHSCCLNTIFVLRSELDKLLGSRQARDSGICQVHRQDVKVHVF